MTEFKLCYVKRWRTLVNLPTKYADEILEALRAPAPDPGHDNFKQQVAEHQSEGYEHTIEHDGFIGTIIGRYITREGKRGVVLQQVGTKVVHVYGEKWLSSAPDPKSVAGVLLGWAKAYRDTPEHRFPSDPHAEFFSQDLEYAAELLRATPPVRADREAIARAAEICRNKYCELMPGKRTWAEISEREREVDIICLDAAILALSRQPPQSSSEGGTRAPQENADV